MDSWDVDIKLLKVAQFKKKQIIGQMAPYVVIKSQNQNLRSITLKGVEPDVEADFGEPGSSFQKNFDKLYGICENSLITFELYDENLLFRNKHLGTAAVTLKEVMNTGDEAIHIEFTKAGKNDVRGKLSFILEASPPKTRPAQLGKKFLVNVAAATSGGPWIFGETAPLGDKYTLGSKLGEGAFGITKKAKHKETGIEYACKSIAKSKLTTTEAIGDVKREIEVMHHLSGHPNVVQLQEVFEDATHVHIVMELCRGGNLYQHIISRGNYTEGDIAKLMQTIMSVVAHCHAMNVLHRDLKPENFLLAEPYQEGKGLNLKATDFGLSTFAREDEKFAEVVGTCYYIAPEVLRREGGQEADIWSAGIMMYILLSGRPPFGGADETQVFRNIIQNPLDMKGTLWSLVSRPGKSLLKLMLHKDPAQRPSAAKVLSDIWFKAEGAWQKQLEPEVFRRMKVFAEANLLRKATLVWLAENASKVEVAGLEAMFEDMDINNDKQLSKRELEAALQRRGGMLTTEQVQEVMRKVDVDNDGAVSKREFVAAAMSLKKIDSVKIRAAFKKFDRNDDKHIDQTELRDALQLQQVSSVDVAAIMKQADSNHDGKIDYDEFKAFVRQTPGGM